MRSEAKIAARPTAAPFRLVLLGRFSLTGPQGPVDLGSKKLCALLAYMVCTAPQPRSRETLTTLLWGSHFEAQARQNLRQALSRLRRALGDALASDDDTVHIRPEMIQCDAARFESLVRAASHDAIAEAVELYQGTFLANIAIPEEAWTDWVNGQRHRLESLAVDALIQLGENEERHGNPARTLEVANRAVAIDGLREDGHRLIMRSLAAVGRRTEALKHYDQLVARLKRDLSVEPDAATVALIAGLRQPVRAAPVPAAVPDPTAPPALAPVEAAAAMPDVARARREAAAAPGPRDAAAAAPPADTERRHLSVLAAADVVGYSIMMARDEARTYHRWMALLTEAIRPAATRHHGTIVKSMGDGILAEFMSAVDAVEWASDIQRAAAARPPGPDDALSLSLRVAIHLGDVIVRGDDIFGDGVNIAFRLQEQAEPGGIVISEAIHELVRGTIGQRVRDLGFLDLKHIERPIKAYAVDYGTPPPAPHLRPLRGTVPSIAVLPFQNLGGNSSDDYFADGIVEDIIVSLASLRELLVISRNSTLAYRGRQVDPREVGRTFGVRYVLEGSVRKASNALLVTTQLCDADTGANLWGKRREVPLDELFDVQDRIVSDVVGGIAPNVRAAELERALRIRPASFTAYDYTLRALDIINNLEDRQTFTSARDYLDKAMAEHPGFAMPVAWAARWYSISIGQGWSDNPVDDAARAAALANRAIELDGHNALALATYGHLRSYLFHDHDSALVYFDRALAACPNSSLAWILSSGTLSYVGRGADAVRHAERGLRLSPFDRSLFHHYGFLSLAHYSDGSFEDAVKWGRMSAVENPAYTANLRTLAAALAALDRLDEARDVAAMLMRLEPDFRLELYGRTRQPFRHSRTRARYMEHLRRAGLPA